MNDVETTTDIKPPGMRTRIAELTDDDLESGSLLDGFCSRRSVRSRLNHA